LSCMVFPEIALNFIRGDTPDFFQEAQKTMQGKITKRSVDTLSTPEKGDFTLWDSDLKGFGVRIRPSGVKTYILHYRMAGGRSAVVQKYTIGKHGSPWTPDSARREAEHLLALINQGIDPAKQRNTEKKSMTVATLCEGWC
jgi:hypothetical protein